jgi:ATP-dependent Clp protease adaptor protein ClpS
MSRTSHGQGRTDSDLLERTKTKLVPPSLWHVIFLNDDFTPMDWVVAVLQQVFHKSQEEAYEIMMEVHLGGRAVAGTYSHEVAETKQMITMDLAKRDQHPLLVKLEKA